jgi:hypothetical protein
MDMKIGIAITTFERPKTLKLALKYFNKNTFANENEPVEFHYHIQHFYPLKHKSIAEVKNLCLKALMQNSCDYLFLFDDDCFPCHKDWWRVFIENHLRTEQHHLLFTVTDPPSTPVSVARKKLGEENGLNIFRNTQGCCLFLTKQAVMAVGGFDESFSLYGYEHEQYSLRIFTAGLNTIAPFLSIPGIENYIWSLDVQGGARFLHELGSEYDQKHDRPRTSISLKQMQVSLAKNKEIFEKTCKILIPLNYD